MNFHRKTDREVHTDTFDESSLSTIANMCMVAAERFREDAKTFRALIDYKPDPEAAMQIHGDAARRMAEQFDKQAEEASEMFERFSNAGMMELTTDLEEGEF